MPRLRLMLSLLLTELLGYPIHFVMGAKLREPGVYWGVVEGKDSGVGRFKFGRYYPIYG